MKKFRKQISGCLLVLLAAVCLSLGGMSVRAAEAEFAGGSGTEADPYRIQTKQQLYNLGKYCHGELCFRLENDIVFADADFAEGGDFYNEGEGWPVFCPNYSNPFDGVLDGNGHVIRNLHIEWDKAYNSGAGFFGCSKGVVRNLGFEDGFLLANPDIGAQTVFGGMVCGINMGRVENCYNTGKVWSTMCGAMGGVVGQNSSFGTVSDCCNTGSVSSEGLECTASGVMAQNYGAASRCWNSGEITQSGNYGYASGVVGLNCGDVTDSYNIGRITGQGLGTAVGGAAGYDGGNISRCYNLGMVSGLGEGCLAGPVAGEPDADDLDTAYRNDYYLDSCGVSGYGNACTREQLQQQATFSAMDFVSVWTMDGNTDYPFPELQNIPMRYKALRITAQPHNTAVKEGETASVSVEAAGDGVEYQWYVKNPGGTHYSRSSVKSAVYAVPMNSQRNGRLLKCKITDAYGNAVWAQTVRISQSRPLTLLQEPRSVRAEQGQKVQVTAEARGDGLKYEWYVKNLKLNKYIKSSVTGPVYETVMNADSDGRILKCKVTDRYGQILWTRAVKLSVTVRTELRILEQPHSVRVAPGERALVTVKAQGDGLKYEWYIKNKTLNKYVKSSVTGPAYGVPMNESRNGRWVKCKITDRYGNTLWAKTVALSMK